MYRTYLLMSKITMPIGCEQMNAQHAPLTVLAPTQPNKHESCPELARSHLSSTTMQVGKSDPRGAACARQRRAHLEPTRPPLTHGMSPTQHLHMHAVHGEHTRVPGTREGGGTPCRRSTRAYANRRPVRAIARRLGASIRNNRGRHMSTLPDWHRACAADSSHVLADREKKKIDRTVAFKDLRIHPACKETTHACKQSNVQNACSRTNSRSQSDVRAQNQHSALCAPELLHPFAAHAVIWEIVLEHNN